MKNAFSSHPEDIWTGYRFLDDDHIEVRTADNNTTVYSVIEFSESIASFLTFSNDYIKDLDTIIVRGRNLYDNKKIWFF